MSAGYPAPPKTGRCYCGCGRRTNGWWAPGHDTSALHDTLRRLGYGDGTGGVDGATAAFVEAHREES